MNAFDVILLSSACVSFVLFFCLQMLVFRCTHSEDIFKSIINTFTVVSAVHLMGLPLTLKYFPNGAAVQTFSDVIGVVVLSYIVFGLAAFVYILCVFGPSETSIRVRVVRELLEVRGHHLLRNELLKRYNGRMVLERRLERFSRSGEVVFKGGKYVMCKNTNAFFMIDVIARLLQKFLGKSS